MEYIDLGPNLDYFTVHPSFAYEINEAIKKLKNFSNEVKGSKIRPLNNLILGPAGSGKSHDALAKRGA